LAVVLITGCNSGFGLAGALAFARRGDTVYGTVRDLQRGASLEREAAREKLDVRLRAVDVTSPETFPELISGIVAESGSLDVLVNNAGILLPGAWEDLTESDIRRVMETNFFGPMLLARAALPQMRRQRSGCIIMLSSLSGLAGLAGDVAYSASKFALEGATEALRHEVDRWGIRLALVEAGQYATGLFRETGELPRNYPADSPYRRLVASKLREMRAGQHRAMAAEQVGDLLPRIADADGSQLRWPADGVAEQVLARVHGQSDSDRDGFLRDAGNSDWWSNGGDRPQPPETDSSPDR
jgi:NAD(P)-dependent dehydrogenase (short-subunit alcohol dehydrogenase family)